MNGSIENLRKKIERTKDLGGVVRTMKALAASSIGQYEEAARALEDYYRTVVLGLGICLRKEKRTLIRPADMVKSRDITAVILGSDQGLVGQFNESLTGFVKEKLAGLPGRKRLWAVGQRLFARLEEEDLPVAGLFHVPNSIGAITPLVGQILAQCQTAPFYIFHNRPQSRPAYAQVVQRMLPLDEKWIRKMTAQSWITKQVPEVLGNRNHTLSALIREYLFVTLFKACAESLAAENAGRLDAMQRAEKNISEMLEELGQTYHRVRQNTIDEELSDIIAGFEALEKGG